MIKLRQRPPEKGFCQALYCYKKARGRKGKTKIVYWKLCHKHLRQDQKEKNPSRYFFDMLRQNVKKRGIPFHLTIEEFRKFCKKTNYLELKGQRPGYYTIDRKNPAIGYTYENIRILEHNANCRKQWVDEAIARKYGMRIPTDKELEQFEAELRDKPERTRYARVKYSEPVSEPEYNEVPPF